MMISPSPCFYDPDSIEKYCVAILYYASQFVFVWCFSHDQAGVTSFGEKDDEDEDIMKLYQGYLLPTWLVTTDLNLDPNYSVC